MRTYESDVRREYVASCLRLRPTEKRIGLGLGWACLKGLIQIKASSKLLLLVDSLGWYSISSQPGPFNR